MDQKVTIQSQMARLVFQYRSDEYGQGQFHEGTDSHFDSCSQVWQSHLAHWLRTSIGFEYKKNKSHKKKNNTNTTNKKKKKQTTKQHKKETKTNEQTHNKHKKKKKTTEETKDTEAKCRKMISSYYNNMI